LLKLETKKRKMNMQLMSVLVGLLLLISLNASPVPAEPQWNIGVSFGNEGLRDFGLSVGEYYRAPPREVVVVRERGFHDEELPVVFFLASRAHVAPGVIMDLRRGGLSWMDVSLHFGFGPEIYYVPIKAAKVGPPYGKAYGYYKKYPRHEWKKIRLRDDDVINLVNLRFISEHHGYAPENVMRMRGEGNNFVTIDETAYREKHGRKKDHDEDGDHHGDGKKDRDHNGKGKREIGGS
jgi:hypothetical protein